MYKLSYYSAVSVNHKNNLVWYNKITQKGVGFSKEIEVFLCKLLSNNIQEWLDSDLNMEIIDIITTELFDRGLIVPEYLNSIKEAQHLESLHFFFKPTESFFGVDWIDTDVYDLASVNDFSVAFFSVPFDNGSLKPGSRFGPNFIRKSSAKIANLKKYLLKDECKFNNEKIQLFDLGDMNIIVNNQVDIYEKITKAIYSLPNNVIPFMVGGDHSLTYASFKAVYYKLRNQEVMLVHFDHHLDIQSWGNFYNNSSEFLTSLSHANFISWLKKDLPEVKILQIGTKSFNTSYNNDASTHENYINYTQHLAKQISELDLLENYESMDFISKLPIKQNIYITFDVDVIKNTEIKLTGYPSSLGVDLTMLLKLITFLIKNNTVVGVDVVEFGVSDDYMMHKKESELICNIMLQMLKLISKNFKSEQ